MWGARWGPLGRSCGHRFLGWRAWALACLGFVSWACWHFGSLLASCPHTSLRPSVPRSPFPNTRAPLVPLSPMLNAGVQGRPPLAEIFEFSPELKMVRGATHNVLVLFSTIVPAAEPAPPPTPPPPPHPHRPQYKIKTYYSIYRYV